MILMAVATSRIRYTELAIHMRQREINILLAKPEREKAHLENQGVNVRILKQILYKTDPSVWTGQRTGAGFCEHGNESFCSTKGVNCQVLKEQPLHYLNIKKGLLT
jgi:hypothetical protein